MTELLRLFGGLALTFGALVLLAGFLALCGVLIARLEKHDG